MKIPDSSSHLSKNKNFREFRDWRIEKERDFLSQSTGIEASNIFFLKQAHGNKLCYIPQDFKERDRASKERGTPFSSYYAEGDALYTEARGCLLVIRTADCLPFFVLMKNKEKKLFGLIHAGWRGLEKQIICISLYRMLKYFLASVEKLDSFQLHCFCGPCAGPQSYAIGPELAPLFSRDALLEKTSQKPLKKRLETGVLDRICKKTDSGNYFLDLPLLAKFQMECALEEYALLKNIPVEDLRACLSYSNEMEACTIKQNNKLFSHRCEDKGRNLNLIKT